MCRSSPDMRIRVKAGQITRVFGEGPARMLHTSPIKEIRGIFTRKRHALRHLTHQLHNLRDMVVILAVFGSSLRVEQVVSSS